MPNYFFIWHYSLVRRIYEIVAAEKGGENEQRSEFSKLLGCCWSRAWGWHRRHRLHEAGRDLWVWNETAGWCNVRARGSKVNKIAFRCYFRALPYAAFVRHFFKVRTRSWGLAFQTCSVERRLDFPCKRRCARFILVQNILGNLHRTSTNTNFNKPSYFGTFLVFSPLVKMMEKTLLCIFLDVIVYDVV